MTVSSATSKSQYNGDGATTVFSTGFAFKINAHVTVIHRDANAVETTWVENTQYTLTGEGTGSNGSVTVETSPTDYTPASGETLTITRVPPETQPTDFPPGGAFPAESVEDALDLNVQLTQKHSEEIGRSILLPSTTSNSQLTFPEPSINADKIIKINSAGDNIEAATLATISDTVDTVESGLADNDMFVYDNAAWRNRPMFGYVSDVTIASAATTDVLGAAGPNVIVTGTGTITSLGTGTYRIRFVKFSGAATLTHNATTLILPGAANITTAAGDTMIVISDGSSNARVFAYQRASGQIVAARARWNKGADIASATALTLGSDGNYFDVTGTTSITSIGTVGVGTVIKLHFDAALILTHNATDLILPGAANITTAAGDEAEFVEYASGDWRCTNYQLAAVAPAPSPFTESFTSTEQSISAAGNIIVAHGLSTAPTLIQIRLICQTADLNYSVDDDVVYNPAADFGGGAFSYGLSATVDATNIDIRIGSSGLLLNNKTTGLSSDANEANWNMVVRAWA